MASYTRLELVNKFRKEIENWNSTHPMDTTHIQMSSLDEMMSAYGYVPRRLPNFPEVKDGRFGYQLAFPCCKKVCRPLFMSLQEAVSIHNGNGYKGNPFRRLGDRMSFALHNRIVQQVAIQYNKSKRNLTTSKRWVKFLEEE